VEPVTEYLIHKIDTCSNTHHELAFTLSEMLPQCFGANAKINLHSVRMRFKGSGGGEGSFDSVRASVNISSARAASRARDTTATVCTTTRKPPGCG
jgi:hypothetical protein